MIKFLNVETQLSENQIEEIEKLVGLTFPDSYKKHLMAYNGGQCLPNYFDFFENGKISSSCIDWFLSIYDGEYDNLKNYIFMFKIDEERIPADIIPIAHDPGGNLICISCGKEDNGYIYFWDHEKEPERDEASLNHRPPNLYLISKNFMEFLDNLYERSN